MTEKYKFKGLIPLVYEDSLSLKQKLSVAYEAG